jgi:hypothetical protein
LATTITSTELSASADSRLGTDATLTVLVPEGGVGVGLAVGTGVAVGAAVGFGVGAEVAVGVGAAVCVGAGVAVGAGVGVAVGFGVGVGSGVAVGSGVGVAACVAVTSKSAVTTGTVGVGLGLATRDLFLVEVVTAVTVVNAFADVTVGAVTARTCDPSADFGTRNETRKPPRLEVVNVGMPAVEPSQVSTSRALFANDTPVAVTVLPATPLLGDKLRFALPGTTVALVATSGMM